MALARLNRKIEHTEGEGNCAFNAFSLALCDIEVLDHIEEYFSHSREEIEIALAEFINDMASQLQVEATWPTLKIALLELRDNPRNLQRIIAPILRDLSITIISRYEDRLYQLNVYNDILRNEYKCFLEYGDLAERSNAEKLFVRYPFIREKFKEVSLDPALAGLRYQQEEMIIDWWWGWHRQPDQESGCMQFNRAMHVSGKKGPPHSDLKLVQVANSLTPDVIQHREHMSMNLQASYDCYKNSVRANGDDTFNRHGFIKQQFYKIKQQNLPEEEERRVLLGWWWKSGYREFLREMRQSGEWAGDLELTILADYFRIAFFVVSKSDEASVNKLAGNYGYFPHLNAKNCQDIPQQDWQLVMHALIERMVIDRGREHADGFDFLVTSLPELQKRLSAIPGLEGFDAYAKERIDVLKGMQVPEDWPRIYTDLFLLKGIIAYDERDHDCFKFVVDGITLYAEHKELLEDCAKHEDFLGIKEFIGKYADRLKLTTVPVQFLQDPECISQLIQRNVIERRADNKEQYKFSIGAQAARSRVAEIAHYPRVLQICRKYFEELAEVVLYKTSDHWSNTVLTEEEMKRRAERRQQQNMFDKVFFSGRGFFSQMAYTSTAFQAIYGSRKSSDEDFVRRLT